MHKTLQEYVNYLKEIGGQDDYAINLVNVLRSAGYENPLDMPLETARVVLTTLYAALESVEMGNRRTWEYEYGSK